MSLASLLLMADGRLPTGGHAHSGGLEAAVEAGLVRSAGDLRAWLTGRLDTVGRIDAAVSAAAWATAGRRAGSPATPASPGGAGPAPWAWPVLIAEHAARTPSPAQRRASFAQGRGLLRAARRCWPSEHLDALAGAPVPWPVALGAAGRAAGLDAHQVALVAATAAVSGPAWAATRLLGLDPFDVAAALASLGSEIDRQACDGAEWSDPRPGVPADQLPALSAPLLEFGAERHARWEVRLFAS